MSAVARPDGTEGRAERRRLRPLPHGDPGRTEPTFASRCCNGGARGARPGNGSRRRHGKFHRRDDWDATSPTRPPQEVAQTKDTDANFGHAETREGQLTVSRRLNALGLTRLRLARLLADAVR